MRWWLAVAVVAAASRSCPAACTTKQLTPGWLWNYNGTIGEGDRIRLTFSRAQDAVSGIYFHAGELKDIRVNGKISGDRRLELEEAGGRFEVEFAEHDPRGNFPGLLRCQIISGSWQRAGSTQKIPVYLSLDNGMAGKTGHMYQIAGAGDDALVNRNAVRFWQAVNQGDKATVASLIDYPIRVHVSGTMTTIHSVQELLKQYDAVFTTAYRKKIGDALPRNMFARDLGIMLGSGEVWFSAAGRVAAINN